MMVQCMAEAPQVTQSAQGDYDVWGLCVKTKRYVSLSATSQQDIGPQELLHKVWLNRI
jgi:hypothetical protein